MNNLDSIVRVERQVSGSFPLLPGINEMETWVSAAALGMYEQACIGMKIVGIDEGASLNLCWRGKKDPTNVLAFTADVSQEILFPPLLGDLVICAPVIEKEAKEQNKSVVSHWAHIIVHGTLHLLGYDHIEEKDAVEMESLERKVLQGLGFSDPYCGELV